MAISNVSVYLFDDPLHLWGNLLGTADVVLSDGSELNGLFIVRGAEHPFVCNYPPNTALTDSLKQSIETAVLTAANEGQLARFRIPSVSGRC